MRLSEKYRIYPNKGQAKQIDDQINFCRFLYNCALEERITYYKKYSKPISYYDQGLSLKEIRGSFKEECSHMHSQTLQSTLKRLQKSFDNFFRRVKIGSEKKGFPRFKSSNNFNSILFPQCNLKQGGVKLISEKIIIGKGRNKVKTITPLKNKVLEITGVSGLIKINYHRPFEGVAKTVSLIKNGNAYYIAVSCDKIPTKPLKKTDKTIGIDLGINTFVTLSNGKKIKHPKPYKTSKEKLSYMNSKLSKKQKNSNNFKKLKKQIKKKNQKITNIRKDFLHKTSLSLVRDYDKIIVEDLNIKSMIESKGFVVDKSNITDMSWGTFITFLTYKAERADKLLIKVNSYNTSKMCSKCKNIDKDQTLNNRIYNCKSCGFELDRDHNASLNILRLGTSALISKDIK